LRFLQFLDKLSSVRSLASTSEFISFASFFVFSCIFFVTFLQHNEALSVSTFLKGVKVYEAIIPALADAPSTLESDAAAAHAAKQAANLQCHEVKASTGEDSAPKRRKGNDVH